MIPVKTWYKTYNAEILAIVETFKTWWHYLKSCKYKKLIFINYNKLHQLINIKCLSCKQVC